MEINEELNLAIKGLEREERAPRDRAVLIDYIEELRSKKETLIEKKGLRLAEKVGSKWYNEGEKSTRYFLRILNRRTPDKFGELINSQGEKLSKTDEVEAEIVNFYKNLYENYDKSHLTAENVDEFFANVNPISDVEADNVVKPITVDELTKTLHSCRDSAPGPDGIPYSYLGALWKTFGQLLCDAWNHSLRCGKLCPSHKVSYLRLIPKPGKDPKKLTNWRPITLSNCDHKLITKTYSSRMATKVASKIGARQTAYLKGRLINDNIRSIATTVHLANLNDEDIDGLVISLDAKKAFDSVEHSYIESCLQKFGLQRFIPIFKVLYSELQSDILVNGKIVPGYNIKRGVKQGDALSCIIFIMCMEPLIANIEANVEIEHIRSIKLDADLPKAYTYADDLNCTIKNTRRGLQAIFDEYSRLTGLAGLELNAEKTEIMRFASVLRDQVFQAQELDVTYRGLNYRLNTTEETKINGIFFQQDEAKMKNRNVDQIKEKMVAQLSKWTRRNLSTLGKILIVKTFGVSQLIYLLQSLTLDNVHFKTLNETLYKFIWNKNFRAAKAPERIKREVLNLPIKLGGFGMLDIAELDNSLKLRALGRLLDTAHPLLLLLRNIVKVDEFFFPNFDGTIDSFVARGVNLLKQDRHNLLLDETMRSNVNFVGALRACKIKDLVKPQYTNNLMLFMLNRAGKSRIEHLSLVEFRRISHLLIDARIKEVINFVIPLRVPQVNPSLGLCYFHRKKWEELRKLTSKEIRDSRSNLLPLCVFKCGLILTPNECTSWLKTLNYLTNTAQKNAVIRFCHGDIYSKERLFRFGLNDSPLCDYCNEVETVNHKVFECRVAKTFWRELATLTNQAQATIDVDYVVGAYAGCSRASLTLHAELISKLIKNGNLEEQRATMVIRTMIKALSKREKTEPVKQELELLLA